MKRRPNDEDMGGEILPATGGKMKQAGVTSGCNPRKDTRDDSSPATNEGKRRRRREPIELGPRTLWGVPGRVREKENVQATISHFVISREP